MMIPTALVVALLAPQEEAEIARQEPTRGLHHIAARRTEAARALLDRDPARAEALLTGIIEEAAEKGLEHLEKRIRIEVKALDYYPSSGFAPFLPYQFRGQARRRLAAGLKGMAKRRKLLEALADFDASVRRKNEASRPLREAVRDGLWGMLREALAFEAWDPADARLADEFRALTGPSPRLTRAAGAWIAAEAERVAEAAPGVDGPREDLEARRAAAGRIVRWCDVLLRIADGAPGLEPAGKAAKALRAKAEEVVGFRGYFRLAIQVYPHAVVSSLTREGAEVPLRQKATPLRIPGRLRIGAFEVKLTHPDGRITRTLRIKPEQLEVDGSYVVTGDLEGKEDLQLRRLAP